MLNIVKIRNFITSLLKKNHTVSKLVESDFGVVIDFMCNKYKDIPMVYHVNHLTYKIDYELSYKLMYGNKIVGLLICCENSYNGVYSNGDCGNDDYSNGLEIITLLTYDNHSQHKRLLFNTLNDISFKYDHIWCVISNIFEKLQDEILRYDFVEIENLDNYFNCKTFIKN